MSVAQKETVTVIATLQRLASPPLLAITLVRRAAGRLCLESVSVTGRIDEFQIHVIDTQTSVPYPQHPSSRKTDIGNGSRAFWWWM